MKTTNTGCTSCSSWTSWTVSLLLSSTVTHPLIYRFVLLIKRLTFPTSMKVVDLGTVFHNYVQVLISENLEEFTHLYPNASFLPKMHYLTHIPKYLNRYASHPHIHAHSKCTHPVALIYAQLVYEQTLSCPYLIAQPFQIVGWAPWLTTGLCVLRLNTSISNSLLRQWEILSTFLTLLRCVTSACRHTSQQVAP